MLKMAESGVVFIFNLFVLESKYVRHGRDLTVCGSVISRGRTVFTVDDIPPARDNYYQHESIS